jgi:hypothetical protein
MKSIKMALLGGAALAVSAVGAQADDLEALKAQIETLNHRVAAMEAAPAIPAGYQLLTVSEGELKDIPGLEMTPGERKRAGNKATVISVLPTADAPVGTTITWSGNVRAGLVYGNVDRDISLKFEDGRIDGSPTEVSLDPRNRPWRGVIDAFDLERGDEDADGSVEYTGGSDTDDLDVTAQARLRVTAATDTAVGEVGVTMEMRADMDGRTDYDVYMNEAWGWWAMTPELTFGGGYTASLADVGFGLDAAWSAYRASTYNDMFIGPADTTQLRLAYASGPFRMAVALEDNSDVYTPPGAELNGDRLGVAGEIRYSGDTFSAEIAGGWWDVDDDQFFDVDTQWQVGAGVGFSLGEMISFSVAAAMGEGPTTDGGSDNQSAVNSVAAPVNNEWWVVSALASVGLTDEVHAELGAGYRSREGDDFDVPFSGPNSWSGDIDGFEYTQWAVVGGLYYTPVDQLTIGVEGEWTRSEIGWDANGSGETGPDGPGREGSTDRDVSLDIETDTFVAAFVGVWRF